MSSSALAATREAGLDDWSDDMHKAAPRTLYICRYVKNAADIVRWAKSQGFGMVIKPSDLHVTVAFSRKPVDWMQLPTYYGSDQDEVTIKGGPRLVEPLGDQGAVVLLFTSNELTSRHNSLHHPAVPYDGRVYSVPDKNVPSWDHKEYQPHITITWDAGDLDLSQVEPYSGPIVLGPEVFKEVDKDWRDRITEKALFALPRLDYEVEIIKVDKSLGLVFGWAIICKSNGQDYYDRNVDKESGKRVPEHIPESTMLEAATDFMQNSRVSKAMHKGEKDGDVVFAFPLTTDIAKSLGIVTPYTGLLVAMKPSPEVLAKFSSGEYTGFSIGGSTSKFEDFE